ncbi:MAG: hypothetical protein WDZ59_15085 [Pirellulales bacterium]
MATQSDRIEQQYAWTPQPEAARYLNELVDQFCQNCHAARTLADRMLQETGTRLFDWVDHLAYPADDARASRLSKLAFVPIDEGRRIVWHHPGGMFPPIVLEEISAPRLAIKVESAADFLFAQGLADVVIQGLPGSPLRMAEFAAQDGHELWAIERHGTRTFDPVELSPDFLGAALHHRETLRRRKRDFDDPEKGFEHARRRIRAAKTDLGPDWTCDAFFAGERDYWQSRNRAARLQKARQDALGLGWANHDHHTYRSSRRYFTRLISLLEELGMQCRERFYAGREAGWGAQVLEQGSAGIVVFADVDLSPDDVQGDFAHEELPPHDKLGTVGLWCFLHGEAFLQAGMHHLECQFDFAAARQQLAEQGIDSMPPFTDFDFLKQAFTVGETWPVDPRRVDLALEHGYISSEQADGFRRCGAMGSHLEVLQRDDGYKGFNQTGISEIITATDPRKQSAGGART